VIGLAHEPSRDILDALDETLGEGAYQVAYTEDQYGVLGIVRTREQPSREYTTRFARDAAREQVEAVWQELASRIEGTRTAELEQQSALAREYRPAPVEESGVESEAEAREEADDDEGDPDDEAEEAPPAPHKSKREG
jgi:hypothetical protein